jgi:hypothetical protein
MGIACGKSIQLGGGFGMGFPQQSGIKSLLMPLAQRLRSSNDEEVNQFLDEVDKMANERFGDAIKQNTDRYNTQRDDFFKSLQERMTTMNSQNLATSTVDGEQAGLYGNYHAQKNQPKNLEDYMISVPFVK